MMLSTLFPPDRVVCLRGSDKNSVLGALARLAAPALALPAGDTLAALSAREALGSTGIGAGIAVPHARMIGLTAPAAFFARLDRGVDWAAIDSKAVDLVFLLLGAPKDDAGHLAALAAVTRRLREGAAEIRAAAGAAAIREALIGPA